MVKMFKSVGVWKVMCKSVGIQKYQVMGKYWVMGKYGGYGSIG